VAETDTGVEEFRRGIVTSVEVSFGPGETCLGDPVGFSSSEVCVEGGNVDDKIWFDCSSTSDLNGMATVDCSVFLHGEAPGVERLGEPRGMAREGKPAVGRARGEGFGVDVPCCKIGTLGVLSTLFTPFSRFLDH
jgi:hypothetical protein